MEFDATFLFSIISFIVFVLIMNRIFYAPVLNIMKQRQTFVDNNFNSAKEIRKVVHQKVQIHNSELEKTRDEARTRVASESKKYKQESSKIIADYKAELFDNVKKEKENLKNSALEAKEVLKDNVVDIAKSISGIILGAEVDSEKIDKSQINEEIN